MTAGHSLTLDRTLAASRASLWRCWTEPALLKQWFCPKPWHVTHAEHDLRPGGRMNNIMQGPDGERFENHGVWLEVTPMQRLVFTDAFTEGFVPTAEPFMTGVVEFEEVDAGRTRMLWSARHATAEARERHLAMGWEAGWNAAADQLEALARTLPAESTTMGYVDGFVGAVPIANKDAYTGLASISADVFRECGALNVIEAWGDDLPEGKINSMHTAVLRKPDETVIFSWIVWPNKAARDAGMAKAMQDPRMQMTPADMPFDGKRMIWGGFEVIVER